jgi:hemerythrin-like domain-containing protein
MDAISMLMQEHQLILRALDGLDAFASEVAGGLEGKAELGRFARFIREFADARHHGKEEDILFVAMVAAGFSRDSGPIGVMLTEHAAGRGHLAVMAEKSAQVAPWNAADRHRVVDAARAYAELLRSHIAKEDAILYPMAQARLTEESLQKVNLACAAFEEKAVAAGGDALKELGRELVSRYVERGIS